MPDLDIIPRTAAPNWHKAGRLIEGSASDEEIAKELLRALSETLRDGGGLPNLDDFVHIAWSYAAGNLSHIQAMSQVRGIVRDADGHRNAKVAERAMSYLLVELGGGEAAAGDLRQAFAERFLWCIVDHSLIGRLRPELTGVAYADFDGALLVEEQYKDALSPKLCELAAKLVRDPCAERLRAPAMALGQRRSTGEMLDLDLLGTLG